MQQTWVSNLFYSACIEDLHDSRLPYSTRWDTQITDADTSLLYSRGRFSLSSPLSDSVKKVSLTSFSQRSARHPQERRMQRARTFNIAVKIVPGYIFLSIPMRERETISRAREPRPRWLFSDSVGFRVRTCAPSDVRVHRHWLLRQHNNAVSNAEKLSRSPWWRRRQWRRQRQLQRWEERGWRIRRRGASYDVRVIDPRTVRAYVSRLIFEERDFMTIFIRGLRGGRVYKRKQAGKWQCWNWQAFHEWDPVLGADTRSF